jgi:SAM-dependent methyltransferase
VTPKPMRKPAHAGSRVYTRPLLSVYDAFVLGFSNTFVWKCPTTRLLAFYNQHISDNHLDVGVGTGYFLDTCQYPSPTPNIALADLNPNTLATTKQRIARYHPTTYTVDVLEPLPIPHQSFDSIGLNYVLHCLHGTMQSKQIVFQNLKQLLRDNGVLFGATVLRHGVDVGILARAFMNVYNNLGAFGNSHDSLQSLEQSLAASFREYKIEVVGCVALFHARV